MKAGWRVVPLGEAFQTITGSTPAKSESAYYGSDIPLVKPPELLGGIVNSSIDGLSKSGALVARVVPVDTVLVSCIGILGKVAITGVPVAFNQQINAILPKQDICVPRFMFYQAISPEFQMQLLALSSGTTVPIVNKSKFNAIEVVIPSLDEQLQIVAVLDKAFEGLSRARANTQDNKDEIQGLFRQRLIDLSKSNEKRFISWSRRPLGELLSTIKNGVNCDQKSGGPYPITRIETISSGVFDLRKTGRADLSESQRISAALQSGDILFSHINSAPHVGKTAIFEEDFEVFHGINLLLMRTVNDVLPNYMNWYLKSVHAAGYWKSVCKQSVNQASVNQKDISKVIVRFPELVEQERIVQELDTLSTEIERIRNLSDATTSDLDNLRQALLQKAFSGELT